MISLFVVSGPAGRNPVCDTVKLNEFLSLGLLRSEFDSDIEVLKQWANQDPGCFLGEDLDSVTTVLENPTIATVPETQAALGSAPLVHAISPHRSKSLLL